MPSPSLVTHYEVSPRDGLQNEPDILPTDAKVQLIERLVASGMKDIEVTSFVRPTWIPQLSDATELVQRLPKNADVRYWGLVPNKVGLDRALSVGLRHIATFMSASETHNKKNVNRTRRESLAGLREVIAIAKDSKVTVRAYISTAFGCPYEGDVDPAQVVELALALKGAGADTIVLGDTTGMGTPLQVKDVIERVSNAGIPLTGQAIHLHDTRGTALVNAYAAYEVGLRTFDGSIGGVGGCPYAPGAAGNAATEDLLYLFHSLGLETGIDLDRAAEAGHFLSEALGRPLAGRYHRFSAGTRERARARTSA
jgi:hydroxymethylglutaryl-CoA lyase